MNKKYILFYLFSFVLFFSTGCNDFLDVIPDDRVNLETDNQSINAYLIGSYPDRYPHIICEMMSDNIDHKIDPITLTYYQKWQEEAYYWKDMVDPTQNDSPKSIWERLWMSVARANTALSLINEQGNPAELKAARAEALLIRAFNHFMLVNLYGKHYNPATAEEDMGIVYMEDTAEDPNKDYPRESVAEVYRKIERDITEALPMVSEDSYKYPVYRFNRRAALAFAMRFNLFYAKYDKVIEYGNQLFGSDPTALMRNKYRFKSLTRDITVFCQTFDAVDEKANFLMVTAASTGTVILNYSTGKLYQHTTLTANTEGLRSPGPWGAYRTATPYTFNIHSTSYTSSNYVVMPNVYMQFKVTDPVNSTGVYYCNLLSFWAEESLLCRAEAYALTGQFDKAAADLDLWMKYQIDPAYYQPLTREVINNYYGNLAYYKPDEPTAKKELHPVNFTFAGNGTEQDNFLQCVLHFRRIETVNLGLRWFDIKRMGIEIYRRDVTRDGSSDVFVKTTDFLTVNDPRRAMQIPPDAIAAGVTPTPR